jgi:hypothetical protein
VIEALEELYYKGDKLDTALLDNEKENTANAYILNRDNTIIYLKKRVEDSYNVSKLAKD